MAFSQFINGSVVATGSVAMWEVVQMLIAAGATKAADSDGTTYSSSGTRITSGSSGAQGLGNTSAWIRLQLPGNRELTIQRGTTNTVWRIKYSASARFTGGSPGATQTPSATDEAIRVGGGTDASPTYTSIFASDATYKLYGGAGGATDGFWFATTLIAGGAQSAGMFFDPLSSSTTSDGDACVIGLSISGSAFTSGTLGSNSATASTGGVMGWLKYGLAGSGFVAIPALTLNDGGGAMWPNVAGTNPHTTKDALELIQYGRKSSLSAPTGPKGISKFVAWNAASRSSLETYSVDSTRDRIVFSDLNFPWNGAVVL
jgi:hypothetical protein